MKIFQRLRRRQAFGDRRVKIPYSSRVLGKALVSCKLVWGDPSSEGSRTTNPGTDEQ